MKIKISKSESNGLLSSLGIKTPLRKIPVIGLFCFKSIQQFITRYKINEIVHKFLLAGDEMKLMPEMNLMQPGFAYSACDPYKKNKERIQKFRETGFDKACFQNDMAYGDFKDLARRTAPKK